MKTKQWDERSGRNLEGVHPKLEEVLKLALSKSEIPFIVTEGVRTTRRQQELYAQGRSKPGLRVTNADGIKSKSNHQAKADGLGYAADLYPDSNRNGKLEQIEVVGNLVKRDLAKIAAVIKTSASELNCRVEWGGDWKSLKDYPHFELITKQ